MRTIILDLGNYDSDALGGKDLCLTDAPEEQLKAVSEWLKTTEENGLPAEVVFTKELIRRGYKIDFICSLEDTPMYLASAEDY